MGRTKSIIGSGLFCTDYYNYWLKISFHLTLFKDIARETALPLRFTKNLLNLEFCHKIGKMGMSSPFKKDGEIRILQETINQ